ncbi:MAG: CocE/NonD family hydrolase, partial [Gemmatimonadales bacterium]|nr:CocE/NonD family hydrolase [Gemmatimonadales bacterium]
MRLPLAALVLLPLLPLAAQRPDTALIARRHRLEAELQQLAEVRRSVMIPMRDGVRLMTDLYVPKGRTGPVPLILSKTPYNFNWWDVRLGAPRDPSAILA